MLQERRVVRARAVERTPVRAKAEPRAAERTRVRAKAEPRAAERTPVRPEESARVARATLALVRRAPAPELIKARQVLGAGRGVRRQHERRFDHSAVYRTSTRSLDSDPGTLAASREPR